MISPEELAPYVQMTEPCCWRMVMDEKRLGYWCDDHLVFVTKMAVYRLCHMRFVELMKQQNCNLPAISEGAYLEEQAPLPMAVVVGKPSWLQRLIDAFWR